jgi:hypothetical protein
MSDLIFKQALEVMRVSYPDKYEDIIHILRIYLYDNNSYFGIDEEECVISALCENVEFMRCLAIVAFSHANKRGNLKELIRS